MSVNYVYTISQLYPTAILNVDYSLADYGQGPVLQQWNTTKLGTTPTIQSLINSWNTNYALAQTKIQQNTMLYESARAIIVGGYTSSALGSVYTYPNNNTQEQPDQVNMTSSVVAAIINQANSSWTTNIWAQNSSGQWSFIPHTAAQVQEVGVAGKLFVQTQQNKLNSLVQQVYAATTVADVQAIVW